MTNWVGTSFLLPNQNDLITSMADGVSLEQNPGEYVALSSAFQMDSVTTPVMLVAGDEDGLFLVNTVELYNRLRVYGKPVTLVRYPRQGHVLEGAALADFWARSVRFFDEHLQD